MVLDVYDFCSDELKTTMKISRDKNAERILNEFKDKVRFHAGYRAVI